MHRGAYFWWGSMVLAGCSLWGKSGASFGSGCGCGGGIGLAKLGPGRLYCLCFPIFWVGPEWDGGGRGTLDVCFYHGCSASLGWRGGWNWAAGNDPPSLGNGGYPCGNSFYPNARWSCSFFVRFWKSLGARGPRSNGRFSLDGKNRIGFSFSAESATLWSLGAFDGPLDGDWKRCLGSLFGSRHSFCTGRLFR